MVARAPRPKNIAPGHDQHQPPPMCNLCHPQIQAASRPNLKGVVAKDHALPAWYALKRIP